MSGKWDPEWQAQKIKDLYDDLLIRSNNGDPVDSLTKVIKKIDWHIDQILRRSGHRGTKPYIAVAENAKRRLRRFKKEHNLPE